MPELPQIDAPEPIIEPEVTIPEKVFDKAGIGTFVFQWLDGMNGKGRVEAECIIYRALEDGTKEIATSGGEKMVIDDAFALAAVNPQAAQLLGGLIVFLGMLYKGAKANSETYEQMGITVS